MSDEKAKHRITTNDHHGNEVLLYRPLNESAMTAEEKQEWHIQRHEHRKRLEDKKS